MIGLAENAKKRLTTGVQTTYRAKCKGEEKQLRKSPRKTITYYHKSNENILTRNLRKLTAALRATLDEPTCENSGDPEASISIQKHHL